jgi:phosphoribosylamine--glycine ligase
MYTPAMSLTILVVGNGAREHALCWRLAQSPSTGSLICAPGNPGTAEYAENVPVRVSDIEDLTDLAAERNVDLVVVGPEAPLAIGLADRLRRRQIPVIGPSQAAAQIETSKHWAKQLMAEAGVPTARHVAVQSLPAALQAIHQFTYPVVIKADGLAAGKGVVIAGGYDEAVMALTAMLEEHSLGPASETVLIEEYLTGPEVSIMALTDGRSIKCLAPACDHKRVFDRDQGPNTGGMGAFAPTALVGADLTAEIEQTILRPVINAMQHRSTPMTGVLYAGLMLTERGPVVLEFNCRLGDPEAQVVLPLIDGDFAALCRAIAEGKLASTELRLIPGRAAVGVVIASAGYPGPFRTGLPIEGTKSADDHALVFHAGTGYDADQRLVTTGGRVLTVVGLGTSIPEAQLHAYAAAEQIQFEGAHYRRDIGTREAVTAR